MSLTLIETPSSNPISFQKASNSLFTFPLFKSKTAYSLFSNNPANFSGVIQIIIIYYLIRVPNNSKYFKLDNFS